MPARGGVGAFPPLGGVGVRGSSWTRERRSRSLKEVAECGGRNIPGERKGPEAGMVTGLLSQQGGRCGQRGQGRQVT